VSRMHARIVGAIAVGGLALAACGGTSSAQGSTGPLKVAAAENFYGDIAAQIGGSHVQVASIITNPSADPHLFEPGTKVGLEVAQAGAVIINGAGYDSFMSKLLSASPSNHRAVVTIADAIGAKGTGVNPHLWYDVPNLPRIGQAIEATLAKADPAHGADYAAGEKAFEASLAPLDAVTADIRQRAGGERVAYTERVPGYLLQAAGLDNVAPAAFTSAIEDGNDPPPGAVAAMTTLVSGHSIKVLLYNLQATSKITAETRAEATVAGIPVVGVSETMPAGSHFVDWQLAQARALEKALGL
jgi:zinc/manganese transport system substrate-binding protein